MTPAEIIEPELSQTAQSLREQDKPFAFATIVRTVGSTAAKPGAKALLAADGTILEGWLGGGCARGAVKRGTTLALSTGEPQLISVAPEEFLAAIGVEPGTEQDGVTYARNGCPSKGTVDIFIEPCLPMPELIILGQSPVAKALLQLAPQFQWSITASDDGTVLAQTNRRRFVVIATQGQGDLSALRAALSVKAVHACFVGSTRKFAALSEKLVGEGADPTGVAQIKAPAGLDIHAVTPEEIALSILAELVRFRRAPVAESPGA
ncbi:XdhC family protein [uncultured Ruegeria sp.]|uniref:XdhC family protein n=1 Tax=uncultured Ruegeria sp. TaxID=259304 RepID=UPI00263059E4|nr:XdhC/CoxI family protein [uncultured Ruegeria sp.]